MMVGLGILQRFQSGVFKREMAGTHVLGGHPSPSKTIGPPSRIANRSATAAQAARLCSTSSMDRPAAFNSRRISSRRSTMTGARPSVGSSRNRSFGPVTRALPIASICCSPPDSLQRKGSIGKHLPAWDEKAIEIKHADVAELVDARDLKSLDGNVVWVRGPPPAPNLPRPALGPH